jgi:hypothetical protein
VNDNRLEDRRIISRLALLGTPSRTTAPDRHELDARLAKVRTWRRARRLIAAASCQTGSLRARRAFMHILYADGALAAAVFAESRTGAPSRRTAVHGALAARVGTWSSAGDDFFQERTAAVRQVLGAIGAPQATAGTPAHRAVVVCAIDPGFVGVVERFMRSVERGDRERTDEALSVALAVRAAAIAKGAYGELRALCVDSPATLEEIWNLAALIARPG